MTEFVATRVQQGEVTQVAANVHETHRIPPFAQIYEEHAQLVFRTVRRCRVRDAYVQDVVQEVFLCVHRGLARFEGRSTLRSWIYRLATNTALNHLRDHRREREEAAYEEVDHASMERDPEAESEKRESWRRLDALLHQLDESRREVLVLAELEGFTAPEIADVTGVPLNTVYSRLRIAREEFALLVAETENGKR